MAIIPLPNPAIATMIIPEFSSVISRIISAYETGKKIEYEMAALEVNYKLEKQKLEIQRDALRNQHKQTMQQMAYQHMLCTRLLESSQKTTDAFLERQKHLREQSDRLLDAIIDDKSNSEYSTILRETYNEIARCLESGMRDRITNDRIMLEQIQNKSVKQILANNSNQLEM